jgi:dipeptidyl aminopeptidase/acylaminoacyl peptidase
MKQILFTWVLCLSIGGIFGQKKVLSDQDYDIWNTLKSYLIADNGVWMSYESTPYRGDGFAVLMKTDSTNVKRFERMYSTFFSADNQYFAGLVKPQFDTLRKLELDKVKKDKWPKDTLVVHLVEKDSTIRIATIIDSKFSRKGSWIAYRNVDKAAVEKKVPASKKKKCKLFRKKKPTQVEKKIESDGKILFLWNPLTGRKHTFNYVTTYDFSDSAKFLAIVTHEKRSKKDYYQLQVHRIFNAQSIFQSDTFTAVGKWTFHKDEHQFAFLASKDTNSNNKHFSLYHLNLSAEPVLTVLDSVKISHPEQWIPSNFGQLMFAEDAPRLFFSMAPKPVYDAKDTLTKDEKVSLDIWHWEDKKLQPRQLLTAKRDKNKSFLSVFDLEDLSVRSLENDTLTVRFNPKQTEIFLAYSEESYAVEQDFAYPWRRDEYIVSSSGGQPELVSRGTQDFSILAPNGKHIVTYDREKNQFMLTKVGSGSACLTCKFKTDWFEDVNGQPYEPQPEVKMYWENDREHLWFVSKHDVYRINLITQDYEHISQGIGIELEQNFTLVSWDTDSLYFDPNRAWLQGFSMVTKETNIYVLDNNMPYLKKSVYADIRGLEKMKNDDLVVYRVSTVSDFPDLTLDNKDLSAPRLMTRINPQQDEYNWAKVELVTWKTKDGVELEGLLYTPENLDTTKSYPMIVYYYELNSENIHRHWTPRPTASIVFPTEYASGGYVIFIPDVRYKPGYPAQGAYDCIMSGTDHVLAKYKFIDGNRMGLQGQSWGGYQSAQLITMTNRYKAAMAGAPVSNMFSAYGGIRWGSGMSRQFQYERTQSRIGYTIWERPDLYQLNSPIFHLPKVQTPLLIMHNDNDGAVPWYQGIELYMGLRRLQKPVWLLNYNGDEHNLMVESHRRDLSIRMRQFFDYYLMGAEMPEWMQSGVKAIDK